MAEAANFLYRVGERANALRNLMKLSHTAQENNVPLHTFDSDRFSHILASCLEIATFPDARVAARFIAN